MSDENSGEPLVLRKNREWWNEVELVTEEEAPAPALPPVPRVPRKFYVFLGGLLALCIAGLFGSFGSAKIDHAATDRGAVVHAAAPRRGSAKLRELSAAAPASETFRSRPMARDLIADLTAQRIFASVGTALKLGPASGLVQLSPEDLEVFESWMKDVLVLRRKFALRLVPVRAQSSARVYRLTLDGSKFVGVITVKNTDGHWVVVGARSLGP